MIQSISIRQIMDNILEHPLLKDVSLERAVNDAVNLIKIVGMPALYTEKTAQLELKDYRAVLPCDFIEMIQVKSCNNKAYRYSTDSFHMEQPNQPNARFEGFTYKLQNNVLYSNVEKGTVDISYRAIELDDDGFPLIVDNSSFIKALEYYIKMNHYEDLFDEGKINERVYDNACKKYSWYVGQAQSDLIRPSLDQLQSFTGMWNNLLSSRTEHAKFFKPTGSTEQLKLH